MSQFFLNFSTNSLPLFSAIPILSQNQKNCKYHWKQEVDHSMNFILRCWTSYQLKKMIFRYLIKFQKLKHSISFICKKSNYKARKTNRKKTLRGKVTHTYLKKRILWYSVFVSLIKFFQISEAENFFLDINFFDWDHHHQHSITRSLMKKAGHYLKNQSTSEKNEKANWNLMTVWALINQWHSIF